MDLTHATARQATYRFSVLGSLGLWVNGSRIAIQRGKQQKLFATLLIHANHVVSVPELIESLWGVDAPRHPEGAVHTCVTRARKLLGEPGESRQLIRRYGGGYLIDVDRAELDLLEFRELVRQAAQARREGDRVTESQCLRSGLALWRWPVLPELSSEHLRHYALPGLTEEWLAAVERRVEVELVLGRHHGLVSELTSMITRFPYHEGLWRARMLALYACGRQTEALQSYQEFGTRVRDELGVNPGSQLEEAYLAILRGDSPW